MMIKAIGLITRRDGMSQAEFMRHWTQTHAGLVRGLPGLTRYVQSHILQELAPERRPDNAARIDGIAELWFSDHEAFRRAGQGPQAELLAADDGLYIGKLQRFLVSEHVIVP